MKSRVFALIALSAFSALAASAQTPGISDIGPGYFNDHQFATFGTISGTPPTVTGSLAGNAFTINFSGNTAPVMHTVTASPSLPANSGTFSATTAEVNFSVVPATNTVTFASALQPLDQMHVIDIENNEAVTFEFLDATNTPVTVADNVKVVSLSTISPTASLNHPTATMIGVNTNPGAISTTNSNQGFSFIMLTNVVKTIRFIQTNPSNSGGSWNFTFSRGTPDRGDAPSSYGDATHISLAARLKLGSNGGDAEGSAFSGTNASGDDAATSSTIIDDEDGISTVPTVPNNGTQGQAISSYSVSTTVTNSTGSSANVVAWADWDGDGVFSAAEGVAASTVPTGSSGVTRTFTWNNITPGGAGGRTGTYLRVRTTTGALTTSTPTGLFADGEAEDYFIPYAVTLPVTFNTFTVTAVDHRHALLKWETESEQHNTGFEVEHSADGRSWEDIGFVPTKAPGGNSSGTQQYSYTDEAPSARANYYRLKQIDLDGKSSYSEIKSLNLSADADGITITPNPADDAMTVQGLKEGDLVSIYTTGGQPLATQKATTSQVRFDVSHFSRGMYMIVVRPKAGGAQSFKAFKQ